MTHCECSKARPLAEWHEDMGPVLWWRFPICEPPYVGTPNDTGAPIQITIIEIGRRKPSQNFNVMVGGWLGYHTHWTPLPPLPVAPGGPLLVDVLCTAEAPWNGLLVKHPDAQPVEGARFGNSVRMRCPHCTFSWREDRFP